MTAFNKLRFVLSRNLSFQVFGSKQQFIIVI